MTKRSLAKLIIILVPLMFFVFFSFLKQNGHTDVDALTFSNTQSWDPELYGQLDDEAVIVPDAFSQITLPPPPHNTSSKTNEELELLHAMKEERTSETLNAIEWQIELPTVPLGKYSYGEIINPEKHPYTRYLFEAVLDEYNHVILNFKKQFDRVRPSYLDPTLDTAIEIPGHPAYPSGHSSQMHLFALIMADFDADNAKLYWKSADVVARNREVAGLHYPSDSEAGVLLAEQFYALLRETEWYKTMLSNAQSEWE